MRVYEYTQKHKEWSALGIKVIAVFSSSAAEINEFVSKRPRPFKSLCDPQLKLYELYGVEQSKSGFYKGLLRNMPRTIMGFVRGAKADRNNPNPLIVPADFLIAPNGKIIDHWYGRYAGDNIPMRRINRFVDKVRDARIRKATKKRAGLA